MTTTPTCPICARPLVQVGRGATLRKHGPRWVCPVARAEETAYFAGMKRLEAERPDLNGLQRAGILLANDPRTHRCAYVFRDDDPYIRPEMEF